MKEFLQVISMALQIILFLCILCSSGFVVILLIIIIRGIIDTVRENLKRKKQHAGGDED